MEKLTLKSNIQPAVMSFNLQEIKSNLDARLEDYRKLVVTEDSLAGCKNASRELASFRNRLDEFRKTQKKEAEKPINTFEKEVKDLIEQVKEAEKPLNDALEVYAEKERQKKRDFAKSKFKEAAEQIGLRPEYCAMFVSRKEFTNVNTTLKSIREDVQAQAEALRQKQDEHDRNIALIQETVETENARIQVKLSPEEFLEEFERTDDVLEVIRKIKKRAEDIFQQEKRLEEERLERERKEKERLEQERLQREREEQERMKQEQLEMERQEQERLAAEEAAAKATETAVDGNAPADTADMGEAITIPSELFDSIVMPASPDGNETAVPSMAVPGGAEMEESAREKDRREAAAPAPQVKSEKQFEVTFRVTGGFEVLRTLNQYLKENGIAYSVLEQKKI